MSRYHYEKEAGNAPTGVSSRRLRFGGVRPLIIGCLVALAGWRCSNGPAPATYSTVYRLISHDGPLQVVDSETTLEDLHRYADSSGEVKIKVRDTLLPGTVLFPETHREFFVNAFPVSGLNLHVFCPAGFAPGVEWVEMEATINYHGGATETCRWKVSPGDMTALDWHYQELDCGSADMGAEKVAFRVRKVRGSTQGAGKSVPVFVGNPVLTCSAVEPVLPNVVIVLLDTLRADAVGAYGCPDPVTPFFDKLARTGIQCVHARSTSCWTMPSVNSLFTGLYPSSSRDMEKGLMSFSPPVTTLAQQMAAAGYLTTAINSNVLITEENQYDLGFDYYDSYPLRYWQDGAPLRMYERARAVIDRHPDLPVFMYFHSIDPHDRYNAADPFRSIFEVTEGDFRANVADGNAGKLNMEISEEPDFTITPMEITSLWERYQAEIRYMDGICEWLFWRLREQGGARDTLLIVLGDHGESFYEHGWFQHGKDLREESVCIPMIYHFPGRFQSSALLAENVSLVDVYPSILSLVSLPGPAHLEGINIFQGNRELMRDRPVLTQFRSLNHPTPYWRAAYMGEKKLLLRAGQPPESIDLTRDPAEKTPGGYGVTDPRLEAAMRDSISRERSQWGRDPRRAADESMAEKLRALGYIK